MTPHCFYLSQSFYCFALRSKIRWIARSKPLLTQVKTFMARVQGKSKPGFWASEKLGPRSKPLLTQVKTFMARVQGKSKLRFWASEKLGPRAKPLLTQVKAFVDSGQRFYCLIAYWPWGKEIMLQVQGKAKALTQGKTFVDPGQNLC